MNELNLTEALAWVNGRRSQAGLIPLAEWPPNENKWPRAMTCPVAQGLPGDRVVVSSTYIRDKLDPYGFIPPGFVAQVINYFDGKDSDL